ncbi:MAG: hypothetical protein IJ228_03550 [Succinivibrio sp.]|nr:hypothetical protein [Succinivibrio sp.]
MSDFKHINNTLSYDPDCGYFRVGYCDYLGNGAEFYLKLYGRMRLVRMNYNDWPLERGGTRNGWYISSVSPTGGFICSDPTLYIGQLAAIKGVK